MKTQNKNGKRRYNNESSIDTSIKALNRKKMKINSSWQLFYNRRHRNYRLVRKEVELDDYVFYSILNTDIVMELGIAASVIARSILALYNKLAADPAKKPYINEWKKSGENIIVLGAYNHKHLKYLEDEAKFAALGKHAVYHRWHHSRIILALSVFGRKEEIEDIFDELPYLRRGGIGLRVLGVRRYYW